MSKDAPDPYKQARKLNPDDLELPNYRVFILQVTPDVGAFSDEIMESMIQHTVEDQLHRMGFTLKNIFVKSAGQYQPPT
jgi:hypothetical protein